MSNPTSNATPKPTPHNLLVIDDETEIVKALSRQFRDPCADLVGPVGAAADVVGQGRPLAAAEPLGELLGQALDGVTLGVGGHGGASNRGPRQ